jgi:uncharacterized protein YodC (DUF2158 family)
VPVTFRAGDVVRLKSGGPPMTVIATRARSEPGSTECAWFDSDRGFVTARIPVIALECIASSQRVDAPPFVLTDTAPRPPD